MTLSPSMPSQPATPASAAIAHLRARLDGERLLTGALMGLYFEDLGDGESIALGAEQPYPLASVIKLPIVACLLEQADRGHLRLDELIAMDLSDPAFSQEDGSGVLTYLTSRVALSLQDLAALSLIESDNLATNVLIDRLGMETVNAFCSARGLPGTRLTHRIENFAVLRQEGSNPGTARDLGTLLAAIVRRRIPYSGWLIGTLGKQKYTMRIPYFLPDDDDLHIGNKTGTLNTLTHDAAFVLHPRFAYTLTILTRHQTTSANAALLIARCSELIYRYVEAKYAPSVAASAAPGAPGAPRA